MTVGEERHRSRLASCGPSRAARSDGSVHHTKVCPDCRPMPRHTGLTAKAAASGAPEPLTEISAQPVEDRQASVATMGAAYAGAASAGTLPPGAIRVPSPVAPPNDTAGHMARGDLRTPCPGVPSPHMHRGAVNLTCAISAISTTGASAAHPRSLAGLTEEARRARDAGASLIQVLFAHGDGMSYEMDDT